MDVLDTIRYMGIKTPLLDYVIPTIEKVTRLNGTVLDIMAGSNAVSYALKRNFTVYTNDVQEYSYAISLGTIVNQSDCITSNLAEQDLYDLYVANKEKKYYSFFEDVYSGTYFSREQCIDIDSIRFAIGNISPLGKKNLYMLALMCAMCKVQSTPGHFAQFMPSNHSRIIPLQKMDLFKEFINKCDAYNDIVFSNNNNKAFCSDYKELLKNKSICDSVDTIYLDSPYSQEQYSRFYHILETVVKYDYPSVNFKAKYREDRYKSDFCYKNRVANEFAKIVDFSATNNINLVISYSNRALLPVSELLNICKNRFSNTQIEEIDYKHSTQGKGTTLPLKEVIVTCKK